MATNTTYKPTKFLNNPETINDIGFRLLLVPLFGIAIPLMTNLVPHKLFSVWEINLSYLFTICMALIIYEGCRYLLFTLRSYFDWLNKPFKKIIAIVITVPFFCVPVSVLLLIAWYHLFLNGQVNWLVIKQATFIITVTVFFLINIYETVFAVRDMAADRVKKEQLERAMAEAQLEALKNQIDPHFIFNSLNTLSHLIESNPVKARVFNDHLAEVYRYILLHKASKLVLLGEEIRFLTIYFALLQIRFEAAVQLNLLVDPESLQAFLIPPISLQLLVENAIKHNEFSDANPLVINIVLARSELVVSNTFRKKVGRKMSAKVGLLNLSERYKLTTDYAITVNQDNNDFSVHLPLLAID